MKIKFLGTAAAEGFPAVFCRCPYCEEARKRGGKSIRTRPQLLVNHDLLIDFPSDTYAHALREGVRMDELKYLFVTHSHLDHFSCEDLVMRGVAFAHNIREPLLRVYGNTGVKKAFDHFYAHEMFGPVREGYDFHLITDLFQPIQAGEYEVIPLPARHMTTEQALIYIVKYHGKTILYGTDTGMFYDEIFRYLADSKIRFDLVILDCTMVDNPTKDTDTHMDISRNVRCIETMRRNGNIDEKTILYATHFSHNGNPIQEILEQKLQPYGIKPAYDGLEIEIL